MKGNMIAINLTLVSAMILGINALSSGLCLRPLDLAFVIDSSSSIPTNDFKLQMEFVKDLVRSLEIGPDQTRVAAITFSANVYPGFEFDDYITKNQVLQALDDISFSPGDATRTYRALEHTRDIIFAPGNGERPGIPDVVIVLTDGETNPGNYDHHWKESAKNQTQIEAAKIRAMPAEVYAIGVGSAVNVDELKGISSNPDDLYTFQVSSFRELNSGHVMDRILYTACSLTTIKPIIPTQRPTTPPCRDTNIADIFFVVDESSSLDIAENFQKELTFVSSVIDEYDIRPSNVRVGIMTFSTKPRMLIHLNDYKTKSGIAAMLKTIPWKGGDTYMDKALELLMSEGLSPLYGSRSNVPQIAVIITDGQSTDPPATERAISQLKQRNFEVYAIGVGPERDPRELVKIATDPSHVYEVENVDGLAALRKQLVTQLCGGDESKTSKPITIKPIISTLSPTTPSCRDTKMADVFFLVDESSSLDTARNFQKELTFVSSVIDEYDIRPSNVRVGIMTFSTKPRMLIHLNDYKTKFEIAAMLKTIPWNGGDTYLDKALELLMSEGLSPLYGSRDNVPQIAVVITDGQSTDPPATERAIRHLKQKNFVVYAIGVGPKRDPFELAKIATDPNHVFEVEDIDGLAALRKQLVTHLCGGDEAKTTSNPISCKNAIADVMFVADSSSSIGYIGYEDLKKFAISVVKRITQESNDVQFGLITFSDEAIFEFKLNTYHTPDEITKAINIIPYHTGNTNTHKALQLLVSNSFARQNGGREGVPKIAIVVTDGKSREPEMTKRLARTAHTQGIMMFSIGVGSYIDQEELDTMASKPTSLYSFSVNNYAALSSIESSLAERTCTAAFYGNPY